MVTGAPAQTLHWKLWCGRGTTANIAYQPSIIQRCAVQQVQARQTLQHIDPFQVKRNAQPIPRVFERFHTVFDGLAVGVDGGNFRCAQGRALVRCELSLQGLELQVAAGTLLAQKAASVCCARLRLQLVQLTAHLEHFLLGPKVGNRHPDQRYKEQQSN